MAPLTVREIRPDRDYRYINIKKRNGRRNGHHGEKAVKERPRLASRRISLLIYSPFAQ